MANPLTKEAGGQPVWAWGAEGIGALLVYRWWRNRQAASAATAALGTTSGPPPVGFAGGLTGSTGPTSAAPTSWTSWLSQALAQATGANLSPTQAYNDFTSWINGGCASSAGATAIGNAIQTLGLPPGFGTGLPPIQVCAANSQTGTTSVGTKPIGQTGAGAPAQNTTVGYGTKIINGISYTILGVAQGPHQLNDAYNVGKSGAPVFFWDPTKPNQAPTQGTSQWVAGAYALVPSIYNSQVSSTPV